MTSTIFLAVVLVQLGVATALASSPTRGDLGLVLCASVYLVFAAGLLAVDLRVVGVSWLVLAAVNVGVQQRYLRRQGVRSGLRGVLLASFWLWPIQLGGALKDDAERRAAAARASAQRAGIGPLPAAITGTVSFTYHVGSETGEDVVWLEEYPDLELLVTSARFDEIGIAEGARVTLEIEERAAARDGDTRRSLWIVDGARQQPS